MAKRKRKSRNWSVKEMKQIEIFIDGAVAAGKSKMQGYDDAAAHFGVTRNAISIRYGRYLGNIKMSKAKTNTVKEPTVDKVKTRKPYKKRALKPEVMGRSMTLKIKDVQINLKSGEIKIIY